jgi:molybdenum cofactor cytidylyltransferase
MTFRPSNPHGNSVSVAAIVLAAGASARLGKPKQLLRPTGLGGETLLDHTIGAAGDGGAMPIFVVLGAHAEAIQREARLQGCIVVRNEAWGEGMSSSVRTGVSAVGKNVADASGVLLLVCDQPGLTAEHVRALLAAHGNEPSNIAASHYAGRLGVPAVVPRAVFPALMELQGDQGARSIFEQPGLAIQAVEFPQGERDIDSPEDLRRLEMEAAKRREH